MVEFFGLIIILEIKILLQMRFLFEYFLDLLLLVTHDQPIQNLLIELPIVLIEILLLQRDLVDQAI